MADQTSAAPKPATPTVSDVRDQKALRGNKEAWKQKLTPTAAEQIPSISSWLQDATQEISDAAQQIPDAASTLLPSSASGASNVDLNSQGRNTNSTKQKAKSDLKKVHNSGKNKQKQAQSDLDWSK